MIRDIYDQWVLDAFGVDPSTYAAAPPKAKSAASSPAPAGMPLAGSVVATAGEDAAAKAAFAKNMTTLGRKATRQDADVVAEHVAKVIPMHDLKTLEDAGVVFTVTRGGVATELPELAKVHPRGHTDDDTWSTTPGTYWPAKREIIIVTQDGPNGSRVMPGKAVSASVDVLAHETGHALNRLRNWTDASDTDEFKAAYAAPMSGHLTDHYYHQTLPSKAVGRDEADAESYAMALVAPAQLKAESPALYAYWQKRLSK